MVKVPETNEILQAAADRRSGHERRKTKRFTVTLDIDWANGVTRGRGTLSDISDSGCFILSAATPEEGELVKLFLPMSDGMQVDFDGQVSNLAPEIGFAVEFLFLTPTQKEFLASFVQMYSDE
jgi:c-di-GMP-binding flagellar brake protein YcgR